MRHNEKQYSKFINYALSIVNADKTYEEILEEEKNIKGKKPKDYKPYYLRFPFRDNEDFEKWMGYLEREVRKLNPSLEEEKLKMEVNFVDCLVGLSQIYIFQSPIEEKKQLKLEI